MISLSRRSILSGLIAAPAVIRLPGLLMPVKAESVRFTYQELYADHAGAYFDLITQNNALLNFLTRHGHFYMKQQA